MFGAIAGDVIGSVFEHNPTKSTGISLFHPESRFTDDTVLTIAVATTILERGDYVEPMRKLGLTYPDCGFGETFKQWLYQSEDFVAKGWWNGSAMRVSPVGFAFDTVEEVLTEAERSAITSHDHPEGIKGAQAVALAIYLAKEGQRKEEIRAEIARRFEYDLDRTVDGIRPGYGFDVTCQGSVPEGIIAFLDSTSYEDAIRKAISLGGDADTLAAIAGGIAQAFYREIPQAIINGVRARLPAEFLLVIDQFNQHFGIEL